MNKWNLWSSYPAMPESWKGCASIITIAVGPRKHVRRSVACVIQILKLNSLCSTRGGRYLSSKFQACGKYNIVVFTSFCTVSAGLYVSGVFRIYHQFKFELRSVNSSPKGSLLFFILDLEHLHLILRLQHLIQWGWPSYVSVVDTRENNENPLYSYFPPPILYPDAYRSHGNLHTR